jgi:hypothetical protein
MSSPDRCITPPGTVSINENDAVQDTPIIDTLAAVAFGEIGLMRSHLIVGQPKQFAISQAPIRPFES